MVLAAILHSEGGAGDTDEAEVQLKEALETGATIKIDVTGEANSQ